MTIAPDAPAGSYEARVVGKNGITNVRALLVGRRRNSRPQPTTPRSTRRCRWANCATWALMPPRQCSSMQSNWASGNSTLFFWGATDAPIHG